MVRLAARASFALVSLAFAAPAFAGGFEIGDNGTRALGRGGAYVAGVDEPSAIYYNPAGLMRIDGTAATLNLNLLDSNTTFQRAPFIYEDELDRRDPEREIRFSRETQQTKIFPAPMGFAATNFGLENWRFGIGAYGPSAFGAPSYRTMQRRPDDFAGDPCGVYTPCRDVRAADGEEDIDESVITRDGGQAYMIEEQSVLVIYPSLAVAHLFEDANLSVGLTAQLALLIVDFSVGVDGDLSQATDIQGENVQSTERDDFYVPTTLNATGVSGTGILGLMWEPHPRVAIGASYRPQFGFHAKGDIDLVFPPGLSGADLSLTDDSATLDLRFPDVVRAGVEYTHLNAAEQPVFDIEFNFVWENWSVTESFVVNVPGRVDDSAGTLDNRAIPELVLPKEYRDSYSLRLGGDVSALLDAEGHGPVFRWGVGYERGASPEEWTNLDFPSLTRVSGSVGFSYHVGDFSIDLGYSYVWSPDLTVEDGEYQLLAPLYACNDPSNPSYPADRCAELEGTAPTHAVNNGDYETWTQIFSIGTTYGW